MKIKVDATPEGYSICPWCSTIDSIYWDLKDTYNCKKCEFNIIPDPDLIQKVPNLTYLADQKTGGYIFYGHLIEINGTKYTIEQFQRLLKLRAFI